MRNHDELEEYLRQFRPVAPDALPAVPRARFSDRKIHFVAWSAAAVMLLGALMLLRHGSVPSGPPQGDGVATQLQPLTQSQPLTIGEANAMVAQSPSVQSVINHVSFQVQASRLSKGTQSALTVLGKEKTKL